MLSFSELELPEVDRTIGTGSPNEYIESPMSDGTIEEDFEKALAREVADRRLSGDTGEGFSKKTRQKFEIHNFLRQIFFATASSYHQFPENKNLEHTSVFNQMLF